MNYIKEIIIGMILGASNVIPGVSAGTMAVIMGIYDKLLDSLTTDINKLKKRAPFLATILLGMGLGILLFSRIITFLYTNYTMATNFTFIGLIIGSIPMILNKAKEEGEVKAKSILPFVITLTIMLFMALSPHNKQDQVAVVLSADVAIRLFIAGAIAAFAMIIPGISGSFVMLMLGVYGTVIAAVSNFDIIIIGIVGVGAVVGIVGGTGLVKLLLAKYKQATYMAILGLIIGSVFVIYPGFTLDIEGIISIVMLVIGCGIALYFSKGE